MCLLFFFSEGTQRQIRLANYNDKSQKIFWLALDRRNLLAEIVIYWGQNVEYMYKQ